MKTLTVNRIYIIGELTRNQKQRDNQSSVHNEQRGEGLPRELKLNGKQQKGNH